MNIKTKTYCDLLNLIEKKKFPILLIGSSGTGKTFTVISILKKLNLDFNKININLTHINKPLYKLINLVDINNYYEIKRIKYTKNLIVEINNYSLMKYFNNYNVVKFSDKKFINYSFDQPKKNINLFNFLGKIFYKKLKAKNYFLYENEIYIEILNEKIIKKYEIEEKKEKEKIRTNFISEESDCSFDDEDSQFNLYIEELEEYNLKSSFNKNIILSYLYENLLNFCDFNNILKFYECLSLSDVYDDHIITFIQCITEKSNINKKFYSFKGPQKIIKKK